MVLQVCPHILRPDTLIQEDNGVGQAGPAEPDRLCDPFLDLRQIVLQDLGRNLCRELGSELGLGDVGLVDRLGVAVATVRSACGITL